MPNLFPRSYNALFFKHSSKTTKHILRSIFIKIKAMHTPSSPNPPRVAIIGGGLAGLSAAHHLASNTQDSYSIQLFDMGTRHVGGRACSRFMPEKNNLSFDHGIQFFYASSSEFKETLESWRHAGVLAPLWKTPHTNCKILDSRTLENVSIDKILGDIHAQSTSAHLTRIGGVQHIFLQQLLLSRTTNSDTGIYIGIPHNGAIAQHIAQEISSTSSSTRIQSGWKVTRVVHDTTTVQWHLYAMPSASSTTEHPTSSQNKDGTLPSTHEFMGTFDALVAADVLTMIPNSAGYCGLAENNSLDRNASIPLPVARMASSIRRCVNHEAVFVLMVAFRSSAADGAVAGGDNAGHDGAVAGGDNAGQSNDSEHAGPVDCAILYDGTTQYDTSTHHCFQLISRENSKPGRISPHECYVAITTAGKARDIMTRLPLLTQGGQYNPQTKEYRSAVADELLEEFLLVMRGISSKLNVNSEWKKEDVVYVHAQRWGKAFVSDSPVNGGCFTDKDSRFVACGDYCSREHGHSAEDAWLSGKMAAENISRWLGKTS